MGLNVSHTSQFADATPERVLEVLLSPDFVEQRHRLQGALAARCLPARSVGDDTLVLEVECDEPGRSLTGSDPAHPTRSLTRYTWRLSERRCRWEYRGAFGERLQIEGSTLVLGADSGSGSATLGAVGCRVVSEFRAAVRVPLLGHLIEKRIAAEIEASLPAFDRLVREHLDAARGAAASPRAPAT